VKIRTLSFIIPTLNEANNITITIEAIRDSIKNLKYEIIVVDNGSTDETLTISEALGADTYMEPNATIARLRNVGAIHSSGQILCFIDSDISITEFWEKELSIFLESHELDELYITGSRCILDPSDESFIERNWFSLLQDSKSKYINSGHLITTKKAFNTISGFNDNLVTGEDYDFCQRAKNLGISIIENKNIEAIHRGYPKSLRQFFLREAWHGRSDLSSFQNFISSNTAIISFLNIFSLLTFIIGLASENTTLTIAGFATTLLVTISFTIKKFGILPPIQLAKTTFCSYIYMAGRLYSLFFKRNRPAARV